MADELDIANTLTGRAAPQEALLEPGASFGPYRIERAIGSGGMGAVYLARTADGEAVALKVIRPELADETGRARMIAEGTLARKIRHPNVVRVDTVGTVGDRLYLQMEFVEGRPLRAWITENIRSALNLPAVEAVTNAILAGLEEVHANGLVHRDLKPENVIISGTPGAADFALKIVDFGIARAAAGGTAGSTGAIGSALYMAPEQRTRPDAVEPTADIYSLGRMLYEMLLGVVPDGAWSAPSAFEPAIPPALDDVVKKAMAAPPRARFQSAREFRDAMAAALHPQDGRVRGAPDAAADQSGPPPLPETGTSAKSADAQEGRTRRLADALDRSPDEAAGDARRREAEAAAAAEAAATEARKADSDTRRGGAEGRAEADGGRDAAAGDDAERTRRVAGRTGRWRIVAMAAAVLVLAAIGTALFGDGGGTPDGGGTGDVVADGPTGGITGSTGRVSPFVDPAPDGDAVVIPPDPDTTQPRNAAPGGVWYDLYGNGFNVQVTGDQVYGAGNVPGVGPVTLAGSLFGLMQLTASNGVVLATFTDGDVDGEHWSGTVFENGGSYQGQLHFNHRPNE